MSSDNIVTHEHLATIEKYMAQQADSISKLADSINELVITDKERAIRDERKDERIKAIEDFIDKNEDGIKASSWLCRMFNNYVMKVAFPFIVTAIVFVIIANTVDLSKFTGG